MKASEAITGVFNSPPGEKSDRSRSRFKAAEVKPIKLENKFRPIMAFQSASKAN